MAARQHRAMVENMEPNGPGRRLYLDRLGAAGWREGVREVLGDLGPRTFANPSSAHREGQEARAVLEAARSTSAAALGCRPREVVFTSGASEALRMGLCGLARARRAVSPRVLVPVLEYPAVHAAAEDLAAEGFEIVALPADRTAQVDLDALEAALAGGAAAAALMVAHHETGVCQPLAAAAALFEAAGVPWLADAALAPDRIACDVASLRAPLIAYSAAKLGGPAGVGWLHVRRGTRLARSPSRGGAEEEGLRGGHAPVALIAAAATALTDAVRNLGPRAAAREAWMERLQARLASRPEVGTLGVRGSHLPGVRTFTLGDAHGDAVATALDLDGIAVASGSPCAMGGRDPSPGLLALGMTPREAACTVRISIGDDVDADDATRVGDTFVRILERLDRLREGRFV